jgi:hypothetical protein
MTCGSLGKWAFNGTFGRFALHADKRGSSLPWFSASMIGGSRGRIAAQIGGHRRCCFIVVPRHTTTVLIRPQRLSLLQMTVNVVDFFLYEQPKRSHVVHQGEQTTLCGVWLCLTGRCRVDWHWSQHHFNCCCYLGLAFLSAESYKALEPICRQKCENSLFRPLCCVLLLVLCFCTVT